MLTISSLYTHSHGRGVLKNVSLDVPPGRVTALIGPNGAGKTTLIRAISGVVHPSTGTVTYESADLLAMPSMQRARILAVVPQSAALPPAFTVRETVLLGRTPYLNFLGQLSADDEAVARRALERVRALDLAERRVGELSGGEAQRVLLARALCQTTPVLLLDEPTAHLDLQYQVSLLDLVRGLAREDGLAVLLAIHDLNLAARVADRVALLVEGRVVASGTPGEVLTPGAISSAYGWPVSVIEHPFHGGPLVLPDGG
jgi:iron complex transport system ATP-binding protein